MAGERHRGVWVYPGIDQVLHAGSPEIMHDAPSSPMALHAVAHRFRKSPIGCGSARLSAYGPTALRRDTSLTVAAVNVVCQHWLETPSAITSWAVTGRVRGSAGVWRFAPLAFA